MVGPSANLLAYLRPEAVEVFFHGRSWALTPRTASEWIGAIAFDMNRLGGVFPGQVHQEDLEEMYHISLEQDWGQTWFTCAQQALGAAGGRDWWWTLNLCRKALGGWIYLNGALVLEGVRAHDIALPDWLDAAYVLLSRHREESDRIKLDLELGMRPQGVKVQQSSAQKRAMLQAFAAD